MEHSPLPLTFRDVPSAGVQIFGKISDVAGLDQEFRKRFPPNMEVMLFSARFVQFPPAGWDKMILDTAALICRAVNCHAELLEATRAAFEFLHLSVQLDGIHDKELMETQLRLDAALKKAEAR